MGGEEEKRDGEEEEGRGSRMLEERMKEGKGGIYY